MFSRLSSDWIRYSLLSSAFLLVLSLGGQPVWAAGQNLVTRPKIDFSVDENGGAFTVTVFLTSPCSVESCTVTFATRDGSALAGRDYVANSGTLTWQQGDASDRPVTVQVIDNDVVDGDRTFFIDYASPDDTVTPIDGSVDTVTIIDDDTLPDAAPTATITEPAGSVTIDPGQSLTFNGIGDSDNSDANLSFSWNFGPGASPATSDSAGPVTVTFNEPGERTVTFTVTDTDIGLSATASITVLVKEESTSSPAEQLQQFANTPGQSSMANVIGTICPQGIVSSDLQRDCNALIGAAVAEDSATGDALASVTPDQASAPADASLNSIQLQASNIGARLAALRAGAFGFSLAGLSVDVGDTMISGRQMQSLLEAMSGGAAGDDTGGGFSRLGVFVSGRISAGDRDRTANVEGFEYDVAGLTVGADYRFTDTLILGGALGYAKTNTDLDAGRGSLDNKGYSLTLFGTYYQNENFYIDGSLTYGNGNYDQERRVRYTLPDRAEVDQTFFSSFDGDQLGLTLNAGYEIRRDALTLVPTGRLQYIKADIDSYREDRVSNPEVDGSGWGVTVDDQSFKSFTLSLGGQVNYAMSQSWGVLLPYASLEWVHEFENNDDAVTGRFVGDPSGTGFVLPVDESDSDYFNFGVGVSAQFTGGKAGFINYQQVLGYDNLDHYTVNAGLRFEF